MSDVENVIIVGSGPAGYTAALYTARANLNPLVIEGFAWGGLLQQTTDVENFPGYPEGVTGPDMMQQLRDQAERFGSRFLTDQATRVELATEPGGLHRVWVEDDEYTARSVILAMGAEHRKLGVPGEAELSGRGVSYCATCDAAFFKERRTVIVGGGDSAMEAAAMLAEQSSAEIGIVHRSPQFGRGRALNRQKMEALRSSGRVRAFMSSEVAAVEPAAVHLTTGGATTTVPNDFVIACLGGEVPGEFLKSVGVDIRRHRGDRAMANPTFAGEPSSPGDERLAATTLAVVGVAILVFLGVAGGRYYTLPDLLRYRSPQHALMKPSGSWGHGIGILATAVMLLNFVYPIRKRARWLKRRGSIAPWLRFHVFVGILTPPVILFHSAFRWGNPLATATYVSLVVVVVTGLCGRFIYGLFRVDAEDGKRAAELRGRLQPVLAALGSLPGLEMDLERSAALAQLSALAEAPGAMPASLGQLLWRMPAAAWTLRRTIRQLEAWFVDGRAFPAFRAQLIDLRRRDVKLRFHRGFKRLMHGWRIFHVTLSLVLLGLIGAHIWISLRIGFKWLWS